MKKTVAIIVNPFAMLLPVIDCSGEETAVVVCVYPTHIDVYTNKIRAEVGVAMLEQTGRILTMESVMEMRKTAVYRAERWPITISFPADATRDEVQTELTYIFGGGGGAITTTEEKVVDPIPRVTPDFCNDMSGCVRG